MMSFAWPVFFDFQAVKFRSEMATVFNKAIEIQDSISKNSGGKWAWADNDQNKGWLSRILEVVKSKMTDFGREMITEDPQTLRRAYDEADLETHLMQFLGLEADVGSLSECVNTLIARKQSTNAGPMKATPKVAMKAMKTS